MPEYLCSESAPTWNRHVNLGRICRFIWFDVFCWFLCRLLRSEPFLLNFPPSFLGSLYSDPTRWQIVKHTTIFLSLIYLVREFSDIDLMAPPPGAPMWFSEENWRRFQCRYVLEWSCTTVHRFCVHLTLTHFYLDYHRRRVNNYYSFYFFCILFD